MRPTPEPSARPEPLRPDLAAQVRDRVAAATAGGRPAVVVLAGEAGSGKSTLLAEVRAVADPSWRVVTQTSVAAEASMSFVGLTDLVEALTSPPPPAADVDADVLEAALLGRPGAEPPSSLALGGALRRLLTAAAEQCPVLLVLDDVHWLDRDTLDLLAFAARRVRDRPLVVLAAARTEPHPLLAQIEGDGPAPEHWRALLTAPGAELVTLSDVPADAIAALLGSAHPTMGADRVARILERAGGNPFWALELARRPDTDTADPADSAARSRIQRLADALPPDDLLVLAVVRAAGRPHTSELVAALAGGVADPQAAVAAAEAAGVVRLVGQRWLPTHPLIGDAALASLPPARRTAVYRELAGAVSDAEQRARLLARVERPPHEPTAAQLAGAADAAAARGSLRSAIELLGLALTFTDDRDDDRRDRRGAALMQLYVRRGAFADALTTAAGLDLRRLPAAEFDAVATSSADAAMLSRGRRAAQIAVAEALAAAEARGDDDSLAVARALAADQDYGTAADRRHTAESAVELFAGVDRPSPSLHRVLGTLSNLRLDAGEGLDDALLARRRDLEPGLRQLGTFPPLLDSTDGRVAYARKDLGDLDGSRIALQACLARAERTDEEFSAHVFRAHLALTEQLAGDFAASRRIIVDAQALTGWRELALLPQFLVARTWQTLADDSVGAAADLVAREASADRADPPRSRLVADYLAGVIALLADRADDAVAALERARRTAEQIGVREPGRRWRLDIALTEALIRRGDLDRARAHAERLRQRAAAGSDTAAVADRLAGTVSAAEGDTDTAVVLLTGATAVLAQSAFRLEHGYALVALADVERARRQRRAAREHLAAAGAVFDAAPFRPWIVAVQARQQTLDGRGREDELTPTERAVVELIVAGMTAKDAGERLFVSHRTVESHLRAVYRKLGVDGRVGLVALMSRGED